MQDTTNFQTKVVHVFLFQIIAGKLVLKQRMFILKTQTIMVLEFKGFIKSKRFAMIIYVMIAWVLFGVLGIIYGVNMGELAAYFAALSPFVIGYVYGETKRPSRKKNNCKCEKQ